MFIFFGLIILLVTFESRYIITYETYCVVSLGLGSIAVSTELVVPELLVDRMWVAGGSREWRWDSSGTWAGVEYVFLVWYAMLTVLLISLLYMHANNRNSIFFSMRN